MLLGIVLANLGGMSLLVAWLSETEMMHGELLRLLPDMSQNPRNDVTWPKTIVGKANLVRANSIHASNYIIFATI